MLITIVIIIAIACEQPLVERACSQAIIANIDPQGQIFLDYISYNRVSDALLRDTNASFFFRLQHKITMNFTITGREKRRQNSKKKKQTNKQKSEVRKFNRLTTTRRTNRKIIVRVC